TMEEHGFGRNPNLPTPPPGERKALSVSVPSIEPPPLSGSQRNELRSHIRAGERLAMKDQLRPLALLLWERTVSQWLRKNLDEAARLRFDWPPPSDIKSPLEVLAFRLEHLRALLLQHTPPGLDANLTPLEAVERYMEIK